MRSLSSLLLAVALPLSLLACAAAPAQQAATSQPAAPALPSDKPTLSAVQHWGVQLTGYGAARLTEVAASPFDLVVVDPYDDQGVPWTAAEVEEAAQGRWLLAYLSIGAAEDYRNYWQPGWRVGSPGWILAADPDWPGNYDVAYWDPGWQKLVLTQLDRVIAQGFGGIYMDLTDAYERRPERPSARADMVAWVCKLSAYAKARNPHFVLVPQNAAELIRDPGYAACVDGSGNEETFVYATNQPTEASRQRQLLTDYALWNKAGKPVFTIEYADDPALMRDAAAKARTAGLVPYIADRDLSRLRTAQP